MLDFSKFVEGYVTGVEVNDHERMTTISLRDSAKRAFTIKMTGVERLLVDEMREHNIIDNIRLWTGSDGPNGYHSVVSWLVSGRDDEDWVQQFSSAIQQVEQLIDRGERVLLRIEPAYGATIVVLAQTCSLEPIRVTALGDAR